MGTVKELKSLKLLRDVRGVVDLLDAFFSNDGEVVLVFEWMSNNLSGIIASFSPDRLSLRIIKCYLRQLFEALIDVHSRGLMHLDIKSANVLLNDSGHLFLADLGFMTHRDQPLRNNVVTRWYKPPELLLGSTSYGPEVDMWGVGCIFFEMLTTCAPFPGDDEKDQLDRILSLCGSEGLYQSPTLLSLPLSTRARHLFPEPKPSRLRERLQPLNLPCEALDLLCRLLSVDPAERLTAEEAFDHDFFYTGVDPAREDEIPVFPFSVHEFEVSKRQQQRIALQRSLCLPDVRVAQPKWKKERASSSELGRRL